MGLHRTTRQGLALFVWLVWLTPEQVEARKQLELRYPISQVWNAALRLVRVDMRMPVTDRDQEGGYVLFDYMASGKRYPGSIELVAQGKGPHAATVAIAQVTGMPSYVEQLLLDKLQRKLETELGAPAPPPAAPSPAPPRTAPPDAGRDKAPSTP